MAPQTLPNPPGPSQPNRVLIGLPERLQKAKAALREKEQEVEWLRRELEHANAERIQFEDELIWTQQELDAMYGDLRTHKESVKHIPSDQIPPRPEEEVADEIREAEEASND